MQKNHAVPIKIISLQGKQINASHLIFQLQSELSLARSEITRLGNLNQNLAAKLKFYEEKFEEMKIVQQELQFRRQQQRHIQQHLDHYQQINRELRQRLSNLQTYLTPKCHDQRKEILQSSGRKSYQLCEGNMKASLSRDQGRIDSRRKSFGEKENHPLTPKGRVNIRFQGFVKKQKIENELNESNRKVSL